MKITDHKLIREIQKGDKTAFDILVRRHYKNIFSYFYRRLGDENLAADLTQETFLKLVSSIYTYRFSGKFTNFIFTVAVNTANDFFRKNRTVISAENEETPSGKTPETEFLKKERNKKLYDCIKTLPDIQKEALILYYFQGLKAKDVAKITGVSLSTAKSRIKQGTDKLRRLYGGDENEKV